MKKSIVFILFACFSFTSCISLTKNTQKINNINYYDFFSFGTHFTIDHLRTYSAVSIILDELKKYGIEDNNIGIGELLKVNDSTHIVATVLIYTDKGEYGFVYESSFKAMPNFHDRDYLTDRNKIKYIQYETDPIKKRGLAMNIDPFPENLFLLRASCYWYQFNVDDESEFPVTKKVIENILRQDIRDCLKIISIK